MKSIFIIISFLFFCNLQAAILEIGIGPSYEYNSYLEADAVAQDGDTLKFNKGSWGNITLTRPLVLIGLGYFLDENYPEELNTNGAFLGLVILDEGSEGSILLSLEVTSSIVVQNVNNVVVERCKTAQVNVEKSTNIVVSKCYVTGSGSSTNVHSLISANSGSILISNSYFGRLSVNSESEATLRNNIIGSIGYCYHSTFVNNIILVNISTYFLDSYNNAFHYNLFNITQSYTVGSNNQFIDFSTESVMVGYPEQGAYSDDERYQLASSSPAIGAADDGGDCGMFWGDSPYILSGIPPLPIIYKLSVPINSDGENLPVEVKAKTNN